MSEDYRSTTQLQGDISDLRKEVDKKEIINQLQSTGAYADLKAEIFGTNLETYALQGAFLHEGKTSFKDDEGNVLLNDSGTPITLAERLDDVKRNPQYREIFVSSTIPLTAKQKDLPLELQGKSRSQMTFKEKETIINDFGRETYDSIPLVTEQ